jgi:hypothetical protein
MDVVPTGVVVPPLLAPVVIEMLVGKLVPELATVTGMEVLVFQFAAAVVDDEIVGIGGGLTVMLSVRLLVFPPGPVPR